MEPRLPDPDPETLSRRARRVLQQHVAFGGVPVLHHADGTYPHYASHADGCRFWDVAGREYIDWFVGGGPVTLGHRHPEVQRAVVEQLELGAHLSIPTPLEVDVAEALCAMVPSAEQVAFGKNGSDVTGAAAKLARAITGRDVVLLCGYHGFQDWSMAPKANPRGIPAALRPLAHEYGYNDLTSATTLMQRVGDRVAAIFVEPLQHEDVDVDFLRGLRALADRHGAILVFDEIVTGFRVGRGGMQQRTGVLPDLTCLAKALANGFPLAALVGRRHVMKHLQDVRFGMTYRRDALSLAAAKATLDVHRRVDVAGHLERIGERLRRGFAAAAVAHDVDGSLDGLPHLLHVRLGGGGRLQPAGALALFFEAVQRGGVFATPRRLWPSLALGDSEVDRTIAVMADALALVRRAMDSGLEACLDGPIHANMQTPAGSTAEPPMFRAPATPAPFVRSADGARSLGVQITGAPDDGTVHGDVLDDRLALALDRASHAVPATCAAAFDATVAGDFEAEARYRVSADDLQNATLTVLLAANGIDGGTHRALRHETALTAPCWTRAAGPGAPPAVACPAGIDRGVLRLRRVAGRWSAEHEFSGATERLAFDGEHGDGAVRFAFRIRAHGRCGRVIVELVGFDVRALPADPGHR